MPKIPVMISAADEVQYFIDYISNNIADYKLNSITGGNMGDIPSIQTSHPLSIEYGNLLSAGPDGNYSSILPAVGVELIDDGEFPTQFLGSGKVSIEITQAMIDEWKALTPSEMIRSEFTISQETITAIQDLLDAKEEDGEKLYALKEEYLQSQTVNISIWSYHYDLTRMLYRVLRSILKRAKHDGSLHGLKNMSIKAQPSLYNYEFGMTMFGAEFTAEFVNTHCDLIIDDSIGTLKSVEESILSPDVKSKPIFVAKGA